MFAEIVSYVTNQVYIARSSDDLVKSEIWEFESILLFRTQPIIATNYNKKKDIMPRKSQEP